MGRDASETAGAAQASGQSAGPAPEVGERDRVRRWSAWSGVALERLRLPYALLVAVLVLLALGEQILEYAIERAASGGQPPMSPLRLAVFPLLVLLILVSLRALKISAVRALAKLRDVVLVDDAEYESHARGLVMANPRVEVGLLAASLAIVLVLFVGLRSDLLNTNQSLPASFPAAAYIIAMYVLLGWLLLTIVYTSVRQARVLYRLARRPLAVNVFDPESLTPFGHLGLIQSLPIAGMILLPLLLFGAPTKGGYVILLLSAVSSVALFVPLWGVHNQIHKAHDRALAGIYAQLQQLEDRLLQPTPLGAEELVAAANRTTVLIHLRKTIQEAPSWPFKDTAAVARAIVAVTSPMVYVFLNELIRVYLVPLLAGGAAP